jgi:TorA maturation chaperone TorD
VQSKSHSTASQETSEKLSPEDTARAGVYRLLAALLRAAPAESLLDVFGKLDLVQNVDSPAPNETDMFNAWQALTAAAESAAVAELDDEYHDLFVGISRGELMPYASWYLTGFLMEKPLADLRDDLQVLGLEQLEDIKEPEDHVAALCEAMALLIESGELYADQQQKFFFHHIQSWMSQFFVDLQAARSAQFYSAVGGFGENFLNIEQRYMEMST